jgi:heme exporter protein A
LWILDEPFTSLDTHGISVVESLFSHHVANGGMLAMTSHHAVNLDTTAAVHRINLSE